jgi:ribokinase
VTSPVVAVLGAINVDLVVTGAPLPKPGETVTGGTFAQHHGGKGGNQATAAARALGDAGRVVMIGAVGNDALGGSAREALDAEGIDTTFVGTSAAPTGVALITVAPDGENQISVAPGANDTIDPADAVGALAAARPTVFLVSLEIPEATALAAVRWCADHDVHVVLNPAPIRPWAHELLGASTYVTPNEHELAALGGALNVSSSLVVVETLGATGAVIRRVPPTEIAAPHVQAVDTTGAGDCFNGVFAAALAEGLGLGDAVVRAVGAATVSVTARGARNGMPLRSPR